MGSATATTTSSWTPPPALTGFSATVNEDQSYISLNWDDSTLLAADFDYYQLYRRVTGDTTWTPFATIKNQSQSYYYDYSAGQGVSYDYYVTQLEVIPGDADLESPSPGAITVSLTTDTWFLIGADFSVSHIFELPVTAEQHTQPIQQEVFEPLGSNRKTIARGNVLGMEGNLTIDWLDTERVLALSQVSYITNTAGPHILKSPFGDVWMVEFVSGGTSGGSSSTITYLPGGNVEVVLSWIEVA